MEERKVTYGELWDYALTIADPPIDEYSEGMRAQLMVINCRYHERIAFYVRLVYVSRTDAKYLDVGLVFVDRGRLRHTQNITYGDLWTSLQERGYEIEFIETLPRDKVIGEKWIVFEGIRDMQEWKVFDHGRRVTEGLPYW